MSEITNDKAMTMKLQLNGLKLIETKMEGDDTIVFVIGPKATSDDNPKESSVSKDITKENDYKKPSVKEVMARKRSIDGDKSIGTRVTRRMERYDWTVYSSRFYHLVQRCLKYCDHKDIPSIKRELARNPLFVRLWHGIVMTRRFFFFGLH